MNLGTNAIVAAIRDQAGNMGYATNDVYVGTTEYTEHTETAYAYDAAGCLTNLNGFRWNGTNAIA